LGTAEIELSEVEKALFFPVIQDKSQLGASPAKEGVRYD
jgi:hypothetical protein